MQKQPPCPYTPTNRMKTFKYRLQPSKSQRTKLNRTLELCRWVFNETLATRKNSWERKQKSLSLYDMNKLLTLWKQEHTELKSAHSQVLQNVQERVDLAFQGFFRRVKAGEKPGYPRFRGYGRYDSFTFKQSGLKLLDQGVLLSKIGILKIIQHRPIEGRIKTLTVQRDVVGNWYACFACQVEVEAMPFNDLAIGVDVGLESFATLSNAEKGTPERAKRRKAVQHVHQRIVNRRKDFAHQLSRKWVDRFGMIAFENLRIHNMLQNHCLAKSISDAAWNQLIAYTTYKAGSPLLFAENAGRVVVSVDPRNTSQMCSG